MNKEFYVNLHVRNICIIPTEPVALAQRAVESRLSSLAILMLTNVAVICLASSSCGLIFFLHRTSSYFS